MTNKPSYLIAALLMMPVLASACDAVCQRMQRQQQRDMNYQMHLQETQRIQGQYNQGYSAQSYYPRYGAVALGEASDAKGTITTANGISTEEMADNVALYRCQLKELKNCHIIFRYQNGCFAITIGKTSPTTSKLFSGFHPHGKWRTERNAMKECKSNATGCEIYMKAKCAFPARTPY